VEEDQYVQQPTDEVLEVIRSVFFHFGYVEGRHYRINRMTGFVYFDDPTITDEKKVELSLTLHSAIKEIERKHTQENYFLQ